MGVNVILSHNWLALLLLSAFISTNAERNSQMANQSAQRVVFLRTVAKSILYTYSSTYARKILKDYIWYSVCRFVLHFFIVLFELYQYKKVLVLFNLFTNFVLSKAFIHKDKFVRFVSNNDKLRNSLIRATYSWLGRRYPINDRHFFVFTQKLFSQYKMFIYITRIW